MRSNFWYCQGNKSLCQSKHDPICWQLLMQNWGPPCWCTAINWMYHTLLPRNVKSCFLALLPCHFCWGACCGCRIENDKVDGFTITQSFNRHEKWTKALKYTLCNLKWALYWLIGNTTFQPVSPPPSMALASGQQQSSSSTSHSNSKPVKAAPSNSATSTSTHHL